MEHTHISHAQAQDTAAELRAPGKSVRLLAGSFDERYAVALLVLNDVMPPAEVHEHAADVFTVLEGSVTFLLGGTLRDGRMTAPGEHAAAGMDGGQRVAATVGDTISIPRGVAHQMDARGGRVVMQIVKVNDLLQASRS